MLSRYGALTENGFRVGGEIVLLVHSYGYVWAISSLVANMLVVWVVFSRAERMTGAMGKAGSRAFAKVAALYGSRA